MLPRRDHSLTAMDTNDDHELTLVTLFGGSSNPPGPRLGDLQKHALTTVFIFGKLAIVSVMQST